MSKTPNKSEKPKDSSTKTKPLTKKASEPELVKYAVEPAQLEEQIKLGHTQDA